SGREARAAGKIRRGGRETAAVGLCDWTGAGGRGSCPAVDGQGEVGCPVVWFARPCRVLSALALRSLAGAADPQSLRTSVPTSDSSSLRSRFASSRVQLTVWGQPTGIFRAKSLLRPSALPSRLRGQAKNESPCAKRADYAKK